MSNDSDRATTDIHVDSSYFPIQCYTMYEATDTKILKKSLQRRALKLEMTESYFETGARSFKLIHHVVIIAGGLELVTR
jgi:hypothetical protein